MEPTDKRVPTVEQWEALADKIGGAGGIKTLTTADYNYPTNNPTAVALWKLETGVYKIPGTLQKKIHLSDTSPTFTYDRIVIITHLYDVSIFVMGSMTSQYLTSSTGILKTQSYGVQEDNIITGRGVADNLSTNSAYNPLSARQGGVLNEKIENRVKTNAGAPTTSTTGSLGQLLLDTTNAKVYQLTAIDTSVTPNTYTWEELGGGGSGTQSNWNESDPTDASYIKYRPMYSEGLFLSNLNFVASKCLSSQSGAPSGSVTSITAANMGFTETELQPLVDHNILTKSGDNYTLYTSAYNVWPCIYWLTDIPGYDYSKVLEVVSQDTSYRWTGSFRTQLGETGTYTTITGNDDGAWLSPDIQINYSSIGIPGVSLNVPGNPRAYLLLYPEGIIFLAENYSQAIAYSDRISLDFVYSPNKTTLLSNAYLSKATTTSRGITTLKEATDAIQVGTYLKKTTTAGAAATLDLNTAFVDWEEGAESSPAFLKNKPFGKIPANTQVEYSGTYSGWTRGVSCDISTTQTSSSMCWMDRANFLSVIYKTESDFTSKGYQSGFIFEGGVSSTRISSSEKNLSAWKDVFDYAERGYTKVKVTWTVWGMESSSDITQTYTLSKVSNGVYCSDISALNTSPLDSYRPAPFLALAKWSVVKNYCTLGSTTTQNYNISDDDVMVVGFFEDTVSQYTAVSVVSDRPKNNAVTVSNPQEIITTIGAEYIPLDPNVFEINASGQITLKTNP